MVIIRIGLTKSNSRSTENISLGHTTTEDRASAERRQRMQVHITTLTESKVDDGQRLAVYPLRPARSKSTLSDIEDDGGREDVRLA